MTRMTTTPARLLSLLLLPLFASGCAAKPPPQSLNPSGVTSLKRSSPDIETLLAQMTLDEKIGQMTQADHSILKKRPSDVRTLYLGSVLSGGDAPAEPNTIEAWADMYDRYQTEALNTPLGIPIIYGVDAVHGFSGLRGAVVYPHNIGLGATRNPELVEKIARATALEVAASGIDWAFSPCIAVPRDERWGRTYEGFGETAALAESLGPAVVRGLQGDDLSKPTAVLSCPKHYVGDGGTLGGKDRGNTNISNEELRKIHLPGYVASIKAGAGSIMASYNSVRGDLMHGHHYLITELLKGELKFEGFVVSDWNAIDAIPGDYAAKIAASVNAGVDLFMIPERYAEFIRTLRGLVESGRVLMARIDDANRRILKQKVALRLWERPFADRTLAKHVGSAEHKALGRQAVAESLVLLKNAGKALPIAAATKSIAVVGSRGDDIGAQIGGWSTGNWQGKRGPITPGTSILAGVKAAAAGAQVTFSPDGNGLSKADVAIAVVGEDPYAETKGDRQDLALTADDRAVIAAAKKTGGKVVLVIISGRPLILGSALDEVDAVVAAWLPGTEGAGIADVLFGQKPFKGKLPHSWPRSMDQIPVNEGDAKYEPLFPYGFGLTY
ncbi:MAG TPA: glycoside hydrolase family 3 N-terminal domain-containing protein [Polyangia bacterium]